MRATILADRTEGSSNCYLCTISLQDYITNLPSTYRDYDIQREIVSNVYLDRLIETVLSKRHIPPIVLVTAPDEHKRIDTTLEIRNFKILDGLQRTHRLKIIYDTITLLTEKVIPITGVDSWTTFRLSRQFSADLREINSNSSTLKALLDYHSNKPAGYGPLDAYTRNQQWFEVWTNLTPDQEVEKMLVLNAGHKSVRTRHQLELLFLNIIPILTTNGLAPFQLIREKQLSSTAYSKTRTLGQFHFAHIIAALLSLGEGKPVTTSTDLVQSIQEGDSGLSTDSELIKVSFLREFVSFLLELDTLLAAQFGQKGTLWIGREVTMTGLFGAFGSVAYTRKTPPSAVMQQFLALTRSGDRLLNLDEFEHQRNTLDLSKVNIGNANKRAVFEAVRDLLLSQTQPHQIDWTGYFA